MSRSVLSLRRFTLSLLVIATSTLSIVSVTSGAGAQTVASSNWLQVGTPASAPPLRNNASMVYDGATGTTMLFGGYNGSYLSDTWSWNGSAWTKLSPVTSPTPREGAAVAYDPITHNVVLFGGVGSNGRLADTWTWDGTTWTLLAATGPSARSDPAMTYDALTHNVVLFGGSATSGPLADTWVWNGTSWASPTFTSSVPAARSNESLAYDGATHNVVLFGGQGTSAALGDTWSWDGTSWTKQSAASPPARYGAAMVFDVSNNDLVLFGGDDGTSSQSDTWLWNGTYWYTQSTSASPSPRYQSSMIYDTVANNVILFAGTDGTNNDADTWAFDVPAAAPRNVLATSNANAQSVVTWSVPISNGGSPITSYVAVATDSTTPANGGQSCTTSATSCDVTGLINGDHYVVTVSAITVLGAGASASSNVAIPATLPTPPVITKVVASDGTATLTWSAPATTGGTPISSYRAMASPGNAYCHVAATVTSCVISGLRIGSRYTFTVSATNAVGTGPSSNPSASIKVRTVPGAPFITSARVVKGKIILKWRWPKSNGGSRIRGYDVYVGPVPGAEATSPLNARPDRKLTYSFRGRKGYSIFIYVRAVNAAGVGAHSNQVMAYTK